MHPPECGEWEYDDHPQSQALLNPRCTAALASAQSDPLFVNANLQDSRPTHKRFFQGLTPPGQDYLAGNYRGAPYPCLVERPAVLANAHGVVHRGSVPEVVEPEM